MAQPTQKRNAALTFAAAGATIGIIIAILAGPSVAECSASAAGFTECLRDKVAGLGLLPPREPVVVAEPEVAQPAEEAPETTEPETVALTLLRAEPDGSIVLGGQAKPNEDVTIFANGVPMGVVQAEESGDWAFVPDRPLTPGGTEITVGSADGATLAPQAFVVIVDEQPAVEARVLASTPGKASEVLGAVPLASPAAEPEVAATPEPEAVTSEPEAATPEPEAVAEPPVEPTAESPVTPEVDQAALDAGKAAAEAAAAAPVTVAAETPAATDAEPEAAADVAAVADEAAIAAGKAAAEQAVANPSTQVAALPTEETAVEPEPTADQTQVAMDLGRAAAEAALAAPVTQVAALPDPAAAPASEADIASEAGRLAAEAALASPVTQEIVVADVPAEDIASPEPEIAPVPMTPPTIDAIEIDGRMNFFAGAGEEGATVRLYVEDVLVGDSKVEGGRWLVEADGTLTRPSQRIRVDMLGPDGDSVAATASINFVIDLPMPEGAETAAPPEVAVVTPDALPDVEPLAPSAGPSTPEATRSAEGQQPGMTPPSTEDVLPPVDTAAVEAGQEAVDAALANPVTLRAATESGASVENEAVAAGAAAAGAALAAPVTQQSVEMAALPSEAESAADPQHAIEAGIAAAKLALQHPVNIVSPARVATAEPAIEPAPAVDAADAGADAARIALANPVTVDLPHEIAAAAPVAEPAPAADAGAEAAAIALAEPATAIEPPVEVAVAEPEPAVEPETEVAAVEAGPVSDRETATAAGAADAQVAAANPITVTPAEPKIPTLRAEPYGDADLLRFATGKVIIRRGDTLWDIAERVYGSGTRYQTIYRANRNQIRRPGRIYPGQIFDLPVVYDD